MSRSRNVCTLLYNHMEFVGDALRFYVIHAKNDQAGIYFCCYGFNHTASGGRLFPGTNQYDRFRKLLCNRLLIADEEVAAAIHAKGLNANEIGSHSIRKGASTFCSSGSTACPSLAAISIRAGW
ncbi:hypothetical protein GUITHDRAFT_44356, partial [Guillardia theta CCMP2712]